MLILYRALRLGHVTVIAKLSEPVPYVARLDLHSWLQRIAFLTGSYEEDTTRFLARLHEAGGGHGYVLDIGANVGLISIPLALSTGTEIFAVEAVPDNVLALRHNVSLNDLASRVSILDIGVGDVKKSVDIHVEGDLAEGGGTGTANILPDGSTYRCVRQRLEIDTLDNLMAGGLLPHGCAVIKIDTDGYDLNVLLGAREFLQSERPAIYGEFSAHCLRWHGQSIVDVARWAEDLRYAVWPRVSPEWWNFAARVKPENYKTDVLLIPAEKRAAFEWCLAP